MMMLRRALPLLLAGGARAIPSEPHYFDNQRIDHFGTSTATFSQRYYSSDKHFKGAGHPIFVIIGGEGAVPPSTGLFYPFVVDDLAARFSALVVEPEQCAPTQPPAPPQAPQPPAPAEVARPRCLARSAAVAALPRCCGCQC